MDRHAVGIVTLAPLPSTRRDDVVDVWHGVDVPDPYRWLEDTDDSDVGAWIAQQNEHTRQRLVARPDWGLWHERLAAIMAQPVITQVQLRGDRVLALHRAEGADQSTLVLRSLSAPDDEPVTLVDPTAGGEDPTGAIDWYEASADGALVAYGTSVGGTERSTLRIVDVATGAVLEDEIDDTRACSVAWEPDGSGFFYTRYPPDDEYHRSAHYHLVGDDSTDDPIVWADHPIPEAWPMVKLSPDGRWLLVHVQVGWSRVDVHLLDRHADRWMTLIEGVEAETSLEFAPDGETLIGMTTLAASNGRLVTLPIPAATDAPSPDDWTTVVAERDAVLSSLHVCGGELLVVATESAVDRIERWSIDGRQLGAFDDLGAISVVSVATDRERGDELLLVNGFDAPPTIWRGRAGGTELARWWTGDTRTDAPELTVRRVIYTSGDGTEIGLFLIHRADVEPDAETPAILNGYGGFAIAMTPAWSPSVAAWCETGGLFAVAGLRGGLEHGEAWHLAGNRANKQRVFDDFAAAGDWLVDQGLTSRDRLAIFGGSNGGLLVGAALTQRPDLCRAVWCAVPLLDMIRFPQFLIARLWTSEYGDPEVAEEFEWLHAYSPYHHVQSGTCYPATLLTCAQGDSRVHPLHARKMAAALQHASGCTDERPVLFTEEGAAGHGVGKPVSKRAAEYADALTFFSWQLDWKVT